MEAWPAPRRGSVVLLGLGLGWLGWLLWGAQTEVAAADDPASALIRAGGLFPVVLFATLFSGAAAGLATSAWWPALARLRWPLAIAAGTVIGALTAALVFWGYGHRTPIVLLAVSVLAAGAVGGALGAGRPGQVVFTGLCATLATVTAETVLSLFTPQLGGLFGGGSTAGAHLTVASRLALTATLLGGAVAGVCAFWLLYRARCGWRFPAYLGAGATAGVLLLLADALTRIGGTQLYGAIGRLSPADRTFVGFTAQSRLNHALMVLFLGAIIALLCFGSTLRRPEEAEEEPTEVA